MIQHHESGWCAYVGGEQLFRSLLNCAKPRKFEDWKLNTSMFFHRFLEGCVIVTRSCAMWNQVFDIKPQGSRNLKEMLEINEQES